MIILFYDCYRILSEVYKNGAYLKQAINSVDIEELNRAKTTKICYGVLDKDVTLNYYIANLCSKSPKTSIKILLKIAIYSIRYLNKKPYAVIDTAVELCKKIGKGANAGFVNAVLRKFTNSEISLPKDYIESLSVKYSYPVFAVNRLVSTYGDDVEKIMAFDDERTFVRFNKNVAGDKYLSEQNYVYETTPFSNLFSVPNMKIDEDFYKGIYTFQSIGSVAIASVVGEQNDLLDACAAPGGKSVYLSEKCKHVTACELHAHRCELIKSYAKRMGACNIDVVNCDSTVYRADFDNRFDAILCDVPCSGYGTLKQNPDIKLKDVDFKNLNDLQFSILSNCAKYLKRGGTLVYSTCSIFKEENDDVIAKFLKEDTSFDVCDAVCPLEGVKTKYGIQFLPNISLGAGFYLCKLIKK